MAHQPHSSPYPSMTDDLESTLEALFEIFSRKWRRWTACYRGGGDEPVITQLQNEGMMFSPQRGGGGGHSQQLSGPVWQKHILMGGKCELPDFSGVIIYDPAGNVVTPSKPTRLALPWK